MRVQLTEELYYEVMFENSLKMAQTLSRVLFERIFKDHE